MNDNRSRGGKALVRQILLWMLLAFAFSPVLNELFQDVSSDYPLGWSLLVAPIMLVRVLTAGNRPRCFDRRIGAILIAGALGLELIGLVGGAWSIARTGIPIAVIGMAYWTGSFDPMAATLSVWGLPIPTFLFLLTTPALESNVAEIAAAIFRGLGGQIDLAGPLIVGGGSDIKLSPVNGGLHLLVTLAQVGWYSAVRANLSLARTVRRALLLATLAPPIQVIAVSIAMGMLTLGAPEAGAAWLTTGLGLVTAGIGLLVVEWQASRKQPSPSG